VRVTPFPSCACAVTRHRAQCLQTATVQEQEGSH
jgi:hypothetical protein